MKQPEVLEVKNIKYIINILFPFIYLFIMESLIWTSGSVNEFWRESDSWRMSLFQCDAEDDATSKNQDNRLLEYQRFKCKALHWTETKHSRGCLMQYWQNITGGLCWRGTGIVCWHWKCKVYLKSVPVNV